MSWPPIDIDQVEEARIRKVSAELVRIVGGGAAFKEQMTDLIRLAIDEVIDPARSGRFRFDELDSTEKAYIGVRIEILFRNHFSLERGALDVVIAGEDVDIKNTTRTSWMIPTHSVSKICLLIKSALKNDPGHCSVGLVLAREAYLNVGANQDKKRTISAAHKNKILWLFQDEPFPANVLELILPSRWKEILSERSARNRVAMLFTDLQRVPIPRQTVEGVARQLDPMKRIRRNGGARDITEANDLYILSYRQHRKWIRELNLPIASTNNFISLTPCNEHEEEVINNYLAEDRHTT